MDFASIRIVTDDVERLAAFYEQVTETPVLRHTPHFAELRTATGTIALASTATIEMFGGGAARAADNHSVIVELRVDDVDSTYRRLTALIDLFEMAPTTQPWGNRSVLFRDPDGNLVNLFSPVDPGAFDTFAGQAGGAAK